MRTRSLLNSAHARDASEPAYNAPQPWGWSQDHSVPLAQPQREWRRLAQFSAKVRLGGPMALPVVLCGRGSPLSSNASAVFLIAELPTQEVQILLDRSI